MYTIIDLSRENISSHTSNLVYLLTYSICNTQYKGKTALQPHKCINIHRTAKSVSEYMIKHFRNDCVGASFSIKILEIFEGNSYVNDMVCPIAREKKVLNGKTTG